MQQKTSISVSLKRDFLSLIFVLETSPKTSFYMCIVYQRNKLFMGKIFIFVSLYFIFNIWNREKISMIKKGS